MACTRGCCATQRDHYRSLVLGGGATSQATFDRRLADDRDAYKRLRDEGLQPKSLRGAAEIEKRAESKFEVESGRILPEKVSRRVDAAMAEAAQAGAA